MRTPSDFEAAHVYDPTAADARERLNLLRLIDARGGTIDQIVAAHRSGELERLASELLFLPEVERLSATEVAERAGVPVDEVHRIWRASGFPDAGVPSFTVRDVELVLTFRSATDLFGREPALQLLRVIGSAMARVADATVSTFTATAGTTSMAADPDTGAVEAANQLAAALFQDLKWVMDALLRHHLVAAARPNLTGTSAGVYEHSVRAVGFVDVVGSTALSRQLPLDQLSSAVQRFEATCADIVTARDGRVIKFLGDATMFTATRPLDACSAALDILDAFADDAVLPGLRAGLAYGEIVARDGDCYGPIVNLAARAAAIAHTGTVVVSDELRQVLVRESVGVRAEALPPTALKGFGEPVALHRLVR
jgi:adenylate cyclase